MKGRYANNTINNAPLRLTRLVSLFFSFAFAVIGGSVGLNALIKSNQQKSFVKKHAPDGATVDIDTNDIFRSGIVLTTVCALLALISLISLLLHLAPTPSSSSIHSPRSLRIQSFSILFTTVWLFATLVPFDKFARQQSAKVTAHIGNITLSPGLVQAEQQELGVSPVYWSMRFIRYVAIIPWFTFLFGLIAGIVLWLAANRILFARRTSTTTGATIDNVAPSNPVEKPAV